MLRYTVAAILLLSSQAHGQTYSEWITAPEYWRRGYVFAFSQAMRISWSEDMKPWAMGYDKCLLRGKFTDQGLLRVFEDHLDKNPTLKAEPIFMAVNSALLELCAKYLPKPRK